jgi:hypothetical protein
MAPILTSCSEVMKESEEVAPSTYPDDYRERDRWRPLLSTCSQVVREREREGQVASSSHLL